MAFSCVVVTPERQLVDEQVTQAIVPLHDGLMGILTDRAPLLGKIGVGPLRLDVVGGRSQEFLIDGGVVQMKDNKLTILTTSATPAEQLTAETARAELAEATARVPVDAATTAKRDHDLNRARAAERMAKR